MKEAGYVLYGIYVLLTIWLLLHGLVQLHLWRLSKGRKNKQMQNRMGELPLVTIQVPVYNEKYVVEGLLDCLSQMAYPKHLYQILVLDDSTDETSILVDQKVARLKAAGIAINVIRRENRKGYKAGALQESLPFCKGEFIAIFDADFRPSPDFLQKLLPHFSNANIGLVQARWGHLNQNQNFLTRIQSYLLDTYFTIEQEGRYQGGYFSNFCGTAGVWRKACIQDAGGWDGTMLSEDLDLSYRAQLKGWKIVYDGSTVVPAELPAVIEAFKIQQARWTKGIMQAIRKHGKQVVSSTLPFSKKLLALFHLSGSFVFPCLFINSLFSLPLLLLRSAYPEFIALTDLTVIGGLNLFLQTTLFYQGTKKSGKEAKFWKYYPLFLLVYMALAVQNTIAVFGGLFGRPSPFIRTPKYAAKAAASTSYFGQKKNTVHLVEAVMLFYFACGICLSFYLGDYFFLVLFIMMSCGLGLVVYHSYTWPKVRWRFYLPKVGWR